MVGFNSNFTGYFGYPSDNDDEEDKFFSSIYQSLGKFDEEQPSDSSLLPNSSLPPNSSLIDDQPLLPWNPLSASNTDSDSLFFQNFFVDPISLSSSSSSSTDPINLFDNVDIPPPSYPVPVLINEVSTPILGGAGTTGAGTLDRKRTTPESPSGVETSKHIFTKEWFNEALIRAQSTEASTSSISSASDLSDDFNAEKVYSDLVSMLIHSVKSLLTGAYHSISYSFLPNGGKWIFDVPSQTFGKISLSFYKLICNCPSVHWNECREQIIKLFVDFNLNYYYSSSPFLEWMLRYLNDPTQSNSSEASNVEKYATRIAEVDKLMEAHFKSLSSSSSSSSSDYRRVLYREYVSFMDAKLQELEFNRGNLHASSKSGGSRQIWFHIVANKVKKDRKDDLSFEVIPCVMDFNSNGSLIGMKRVSDLGKDDLGRVKQLMSQINADYCNFIMKSCVSKSSFNLSGEEDIANFISFLEQGRTSANSAMQLHAMIYQLHKPIQQYELGASNTFNRKQAKGQPSAPKYTGKASNLIEYWKEYSQGQFELAIKTLGGNTKIGQRKKAQDDAKNLFPKPIYSEQIRFPGVFEAVSVNLYRYQKEELKLWILAHESKQGRICNLEMGLGKTYIGAAFIHYLYLTNQSDSRPILVVAPQPCLESWQKVINEYSNSLGMSDRPQVLIWNGYDVRHIKEVKNKIIVINFEMLPGLFNENRANESLLHPYAGFFAKDSFTALFEESSSKLALYCSIKIYKFLKNKKVLDKYGALKKNCENGLKQYLHDIFFDAIKNKKADFTISGHFDDFIDRLSTLIENHLLGCRTCIIDEVHRANVKGTKNHQVLKRLKRDSCFGLTGTLIENNLNDSQNAILLTDHSLRSKTALNSIISPLYRNLSSMVIGLIYAYRNKEMNIDVKLNEIQSATDDLHKLLITISQGIEARTTRLRFSEINDINFGAFPEKMKTIQIDYDLTEEQAHLHHEIEPTLSDAVNQLWIMRVDSSEAQVQESAPAESAAKISKGAAQLRVLVDQAKILYHPCLFGEKASNTFYKKALKPAEYQNLADQEIQASGGIEGCISRSGYTKTLFMHLDQRIKVRLQRDQGDEHQRYTEVSEVSLDESITVPNKICIIHQSTPSLFLVQQLIKQKYGDAVNVQIFYGGLSRAEKEAVITRFNDMNTTVPQIIILSLKAGGTGIKVYAHDVYTEQHWNPAWIDQAEARACRGGSPYKEVNYYSLMCRDPKTLSYKIKRNVEKKRALIHLFEDHRDECYHPKWVMDLIFKDILEGSNITDLELSMFQQQVDACQSLLEKDRMMEKLTEKKNFLEAFIEVKTRLLSVVNALPQKSKLMDQETSFDVSSSSSSSSSSSLYPSSSSSSSSEEVVPQIGSQTVDSISEIAPLKIKDLKDVFRALGILKKKNSKQNKRQRV